MQVNKTREGTNVVVLMFKWYVVDWESGDSVWFNFHRYIDILWNKQHVFVTYRNIRLFKLEIVLC